MPDLRMASATAGSSGVVSPGARGTSRIFLVCLLPPKRLTAGEPAGKRIPQSSPREYRSASSTSAALLGRRTERRCRSCERWTVLKGIAIDRTLTIKAFVATDRNVRGDHAYTVRSNSRKRASGRLLWLLAIAQDLRRHPRVDRVFGDVVRNDRAGAADRPFSVRDAGA